LVYCNPDVDFKIGRDYGFSAEVAVTRSFILHGVPVLFVWSDIVTKRAQYKAVYAGCGKPMFFYVFSSFLIFASVYEAAYPDVAKTYNVTSVPLAVFVMVGKIVGFVTTCFCFVAFKAVCFAKPKKAKAPAAAKKAE
jgi:hypothetical protein